MKIYTPTTCKVEFSKEELEILKKATFVINEMKTILHYSICDELNIDDIVFFTESELIDLIDDIETLMQVSFASIHK